MLFTLGLIAGRETFGRHAYLCGVSRLQDHLMDNPRFSRPGRGSRPLIIAIKVALYAIFLAILLRGLTRRSRRRQAGRGPCGRDLGRDGHRPVPAAGGNRLGSVSELRAIWPGHPAEADREPTTAPTGPAAPTPSPEDDATRLEGIVTELAGVEAALRRLDDGSYGICEACGTRLSAEALAANPLITRCPQHAG